jgi:hypothetical protein
MSSAAGTPWSNPVTPAPASDSAVDAASRIDTSKPHPARIYDYWIGGKQNFPADREVAEKIAEAVPVISTLARANRAFLGRAVKYAAEQGVKQFLDIGAGLPAAGNTHEVAQAVHSDASVVYVDNDPLVTVHGRALLADEARTRVFEGDLRDPKAILTHPDVTALIDFEQPVALLMVAVLHFFPDANDPAGVIATLTENLAPSSFLVISHAGSDLLPADQEKLQVYQKAAEGAARDHAQITAFFEGFDLIDPGLVRVPAWRPTEELPADIDQYWMYGGVGRKR